MYRQLIEESCERLAIAALNERQAMSEVLAVGICSSDIDLVVGIAPYEAYLAALADEITATGVAFHG